METSDLRLLLGVANGMSCLTLAQRLGVGETTVRRRLRRLAGPGSSAWLLSGATDYRLTARGEAALGFLGQAVALTDELVGLVGVDTISIRHVRVVDAVATTGSIGGAARHLHLPQPAVSAQVARIERRWALTLFERTRSGVRPTARLVAMLPRLRLLEATVTKLIGETMPTRPPMAGGGWLSVDSELELAGILDVLPRDAGCEGLLQVVDIPGPTWGGAMTTVDTCVYLDLPFAALEVPPGFTTVVAVAYPVHVLLPSPPGRSGQPMGLSELADRDWLTGSPGTRGHRSVRALCRSAGFIPRIRCTVPNAASGVPLERSGRFVALTSPLRDPPPGTAVVRLTDDVRMKVVVGWRQDAPAQVRGLRLAHDVRRWHLRQLTERCPGLLDDPGGGAGWS